MIRVFIMAKNNNWTEERIVILKKMWEMGKSVLAIGSVIEASADAVTSKARRLELAPRTDPVAPPFDREAQKADFAEALSKHGSVTQAGIDIGVRKTRAREIYRAICADLGEQAI